MPADCVPCPGSVRQDETQHTGERRWNYAASDERLTHNRGQDYGSGYEEGVQLKLGLIDFIAYF